MKSVPKKLEDVLAALDRAAIAEAFSGLSEREQRVLSLRYGITYATQEVRDSVARQFRVPPAMLRDITKELEDKLLRDFRRHRKRPEIAFVCDAVEKAKKLTPGLMAHLKANHSDLTKLPWDVFEHLVAEYLASSGFQDIELVGRDSSTSADISAFFVVPKVGTKLRYFVEVKQWKDKVGIKVIDEILGAMLGERSRFGWTVGMLVAPGGVKDFRKYSSHSEIEKKGIFVKERDSILHWLRDYKPTDAGLWLPNPKRQISNG